MIINLDDREYTYDEDRITLKQGIAIHLAYGFTVSAWLKAMTDADPRAWQCAYWLMLQQNGEVKPIADCDGPLIEFMSAYADAQQAETAAEAAPDPTSLPSMSGAPASPEPATPPDTTQPPPAFVPSTVP